MASKRSSKDSSPETTLLGAAGLLIRGDRRADYGNFEENARILSELWSTILGTKVRADQVPLMLVALKAMRLIQHPGHKDSWVDLIGYAALSARLDDESTDEPHSPSE